MSINSTTLTSTATSIMNTTGERAVTVVYLYNSDSSPVTVSLHAVPSGGSADSSNLFYGNLSIEPGDTYIVDTEKLLLDNGDSIYASAGTDGVVVATISYATL